MSMRGRMQGHGREPVPPRADGAGARSGANGHGQPRYGPGGRDSRTGGNVRNGRSDRNGRVGRRGEQAAADYLRQRGYRLLDRNWRSPDGEVPGELDLVLRHRGTLVICEVKARTGGWLAHPAEAVTPEKAARLRRLAVVWVREHDRRHRTRRPVADRLPAFVRAATSFVAPSADSAGLAGPAGRSDSAGSARRSDRTGLGGRATRAGRPRPAGSVRSPGASPSTIRIDVVAVRLAPREPFPVLGIDHLVGVA